MSPGGDSFGDYKVRPTKVTARRRPLRTDPYAGSGS